MTSHRRILYFSMGVLLVLINVTAILVSRYIYQNSATPITRYGDSIPTLLGRDIRSGAEVRVANDRPTLLLYLTSAQLPSRNVELAKYGQILTERYSAQGLTVTAIVHGKILDLKNLIDRSLIRYQVIEDQDGRLGEKLGLGLKENGVFFFDSGGICRFSTNANMKAEDLRQLVATEFLKLYPFDKSIENARPVEKGQTLGSWSLTDIRSWTETSLDKARSNKAGIIVFFTAECSICSLPNYLKQFAKFARARQRDTRGEILALVFDFNFAHSEVIDQLQYLNINTPAYIANENLTALADFARLQSSGKGEALAVALDRNGLVLDISSLEHLRELLLDTEFAATEEIQETKEGEALFRQVFGSVALDPYDVTSDEGKYYVSDAAGNRIIVFNENFEPERSIGTIGSAPGRLLHPGDLAIAPDGTLVVQDGGNSRIQRFSRDGQFINGFSTTRYEGFAVSPNNEIYLGQPEKGALISVYSSSGKLLRSFGKLKEHSDLFGPESEPQNDAYRIASNRIAMAVDAAGKIFVAFRAAPLIQEYNPDGSLVFERWLEGEQVERLLDLSTRHKYFTTGTDGVESRLLTFDIMIEPNTGHLLLFMVDGSIHTIDRSGKILSTLKVTTEENLRPFTPHTTGMGAKGEIIVVPFQYKRCFKMVPPGERIAKDNNSINAATTAIPRR